MFENIPEELRILPQWVGAHVNKKPIDPKTGAPASVVNSDTWGTFDQAVQCGAYFIGFVLTKNDPYAIIDIDSPKDNNDILVQTRILSAFDSYTELSQSGNGYHIVVKGNTPTGVRRGRIELYSHSRYMVFTGNVKRISPIRDYSERIGLMWKEMGGDLKAIVESEPPLQEDVELLAMARFAANADKFNRLWEGQWQGSYPSQSEADFALMAMLCFYSPNDGQVVRLFHQSKLDREKAYRPDYLHGIIQRIRGSKPDMVNVEFSQFKQPDLLDDTVEKPDLQLPPGLIKSIANYITDSAIRPVEEISLCAALALVAGIGGRQYNISGTGLNQYIILLAQTGTGKEGGASGIERLLAAVSKNIPNVHDFTGPSSYASGPALIKSIAAHPSCYSILGEFGLTLSQMVGTRATSHMITLKQVLLDLYQKSGWQNIMRGTVYSDRDKNVPSIKAPCLTIFGESTPEIFYECLDEGLVADGLLPRCLIIEYEGDRPKKNPNAFASPPPKLIKEMEDFLASVLQMQVSNTCVQVTVDDAAQYILDQFDDFCDANIRGSDDVVRHLWNRAHIMALKLAALFAVAANWHGPCITAQHAQYSIAMVQYQIQKLYLRFKKNLAGRGDARLQADIVECVTRYFSMSKKERVKWQVTPEMAGVNIIPFTFLRKRLFSRTNFKNHPHGAQRALESQLDHLCKLDVLTQVDPACMKQQFNSRVVAYAVGNMWGKI